MKETNSAPTTRVKKEWKRGKVTQKMMTFRVDNENATWLESKANKGRYINELIERDRNRKK